MLRTTNVLGFDSPLMVVPVNGKTPMLGFFSGKECVLRVSLANMRKLTANLDKITSSQKWGNARLNVEKLDSGNYMLSVRNTQVIVFGMAFEALLNYPVLS